jgi:hypothetical protein
VPGLQRGRQVRQKRGDDGRLSQRVDGQNKNGGKQNTRMALSSPRRSKDVELTATARQAQDFLKNENREAGGAKEGVGS